MKQKSSVGGFDSIFYSLGEANRVGWWRMWRALSSRNTCKTCALGMGGQKGGMRNELGHWPEVCKKSFQAMASDMQKAIPEAFFEQHSIEKLRSLSERELEAAGRLAFPLYSGPNDTHYRRIPWNKTFSILSTQLKATPPEQSFFYLSGRSSNEAGFLLQLMARLYGTNHINNCSYYCHQASGVGLTEAIGSGTATITLDDVEHCDLFWLFGGNPSSNHPRLMSSLMRLKHRGGKIIVVNPAKETGLLSFRIPSNLKSLGFGTKMADHYVQLNIGSDVALIMGIAKALLAKHEIDTDFIADATDHWEEYLQLIDSTSWDEITAQSGINRREIELLAQTYAQSEKSIFAWTMGITHHLHGVENVQSIVNLALLRGMVGKPHAGLLPLRGHSNVQGMGTVNVIPTLKSAVTQRLKDQGISIPTMPGYDTMRCMEAAERGEMRFAWCLGGNLYGSNPDSRFAERSLNNIDTIAYLNTTLNSGHAYGTGKETLILPVVARDEEKQKTTQESMFSYIRLSDGGKKRLKETKSEVEIIASVASAILGKNSPVPWEEMKTHSKIRALLAKSIPGLEALKKIDTTKKEFTIPGRIFHQPQFNTDTGRAKFSLHAIPKQGTKSPSELTLMSVRSEGQFNTVVYDEEDSWRDIKRRDVILMNQEDIERLGLKPDQQVTIQSETGKLENILVTPYDIKAGNALMYYPEVNILISRAVDPRSRTPAFKATHITIHAAQ